MEVRLETQFLQIIENCNKAGLNKYIEKKKREKYRCVKKIIIQTENKKNKGKIETKERSTVYEQDKVGETRDSGVSISCFTCDTMHLHDRSESVCWVFLEGKPYM